MRKSIVIIVLLICSITWGQNQARMFPYTISLTGDSKPSAITEHFGDPSLASSSQRYSEDGLALTYKEGGKTLEFSGFALDEIPFTSEFGIIVEFKYAMIDGEEYNERTGDGMTMFLYDSSKTFEIGGHGASLGYVYRTSRLSSELYSKPGLNGGYLAVGLDTYGDFKSRTVGDYEAREGIYGHSWEKIGSHVTVRGGQYLNDRFKGYPVLYTINSDFKWKINKATLDYFTGDYDFREDNFSKQFEMYTGHNSYGEIVYNKIKVLVFPEANMNGSRIEVLVEDRYGEKNVVDRFRYPNEFKTRDKDGNLYDFKTKIPDNFKIGFAAGTGGAYQKHLVKDIRVSLPYEPEMDDLVQPLCTENGYLTDKKVFFDPYDDTWFYSGPVSNPRGGNSSSYIDYSSFRFEDELGYALNSSNHFKYRQVGVGTWEYDGKRAVTFTPEKDELPEEEYSIYYSAKGVDKGTGGGPFGKDVYRSRPTKLTVRLDKCLKLVNPNLPVKFRVEKE